MNRIITRFAPSPTGNFHIGNARTALYTWLYSKKNNGKFILRIENTNKKLSKKSSIKKILKGMNWLNITFDEGPYYQSKRTNLYKKVIKMMILKNQAYYCYCSENRLEKLRKKQLLNKEKPKYDGHCRKKKHIKNNGKEKFVIRFKNPKHGSVLFNDKIKGLIKFKNSELDDLILCKSDGSFTYNFCSTIDDWDMNITHIIRGDDHINNTPRQINILKSIGANIPEYAHIPIILDNNGGKLSKRKKASDILTYKKMGFLPESMKNYLVRMGWSHKNKEIFNTHEMIKYFSFKTISKSASILNEKKLIWLNHYYINSLPSEKIISNLLLFLKEKKINFKNDKKLNEIVNLIKKRCNTLQDIEKYLYFFYKEFNPYNILKEDKNLLYKYSNIIHIIYKKLKNLKNWKKESLKIIIKKLTFKFQKEKINIYLLIRLSIIGLTEFVSIISILELLGKDESLNRIKKTIQFINKKYKNLQS